MKSKKICLLILILTLVIVVFPTISNASSASRPPQTSTGSSSGNLYSGKVVPEYYEPNGVEAGDVKEFAEFGGRIAGVIRVIGTIVSVGTLMVIGIRFMLGSAEEKAEYKDRMFPYIIGAILLFGASNLVDIIYGMVRNM